MMTDFDAIWRCQDQVRTEVEACLGNCIWNFNYNPVRKCLELEVDRHLDDDEQDLLLSQLTIPVDYDGEGEYGSIFTLYP